jgi:hypothetical protein
VAELLHSWKGIENARVWLGMTTATSSPIHTATRNKTLEGESDIGTSCAHTSERANARLEDSNATLGFLNL